MSFRPRLLVAIAIALCVTLLVGTTTKKASAQARAALDLQGGLGGASTPWLPPSGMWAEVLSATPKWVVLQTADGKQLPVSYNNVGMFVIRWPTAPARITPGSWVEVTGLDLGTNRVLADHVDVYEGTARNLVSPTSLVLIGYNRVLTDFDFGHMTTFGLAYPMLPGEEYLPRRRHIVGPLAAINPLAIAVPGNNAALVVPAGRGMSMTQVTVGSSSFVKSGDLVWCVPQGANHRTLNLSQMVVYKSIPIDQFVP